MGKSASQSGRLENCVEQMFVSFGVVWTCSLPACTAPRPPITMRKNHIENLAEDMTALHPQSSAVEHVHKYFRRGSERVDVLQDLTVDVPEGQFLA